MERIKKIIRVFPFLLSAFLLMQKPGVWASNLVQETLAATVTGTPTGPTILVPDQVNVRMGPSLDYEQVGVLISGQEAVALGRSPGGDWIQIVYYGVEGNKAWVYAPFVKLNAGQVLLPIIEPPATPTPRVTATIDPTLAAQFNLSDYQPTRLPTFTQAPAVVYPTFAVEDATTQRGVPPILAILGLVLIGVFGLVAVVLRR
ncbi:MAG: SH3 domain-containing protein [Anaerolineales bacterium]|nr:SH3 domain-containing protein [Anaerolineales bacterium]